MKTIYLTFDDGPSETTAILLDVLKKHDVRAGFFVTNEYDHAELLPHIAENGHVVCLHSYCHDYRKLYSDPAYFFEDLNRIRSLVAAKTGQDAMNYRFPGGTDNYPLVRYGGLQVYTLLQRLADMGYRVFDWDCENLDGMQPDLSADRYFQNALQSIGDLDNAIFLSHTRPGDRQSIRSLDLLIPELKSKGYRFDTIDHYPISHIKVDGTYRLKPHLHIETESGAHFVTDAPGHTVLSLSRAEYIFLNDKCDGVFRLDAHHTDADTSLFRHLYLSGILKTGA